MARNHLDSFIKIVEQRSYSKAARLLYISQPALSQQIKTLEADIGFSLFDHNNKNTPTLTPAGKRFYEYACTIQNYYKKALDECIAIAHHSLKTILIGVDCRDLNIIPPLAYTKFEVAHPDIKLQMVFDNWNELLPKLIMQEVQMIFYSDPLQLPPGFRYETTSSIPYGIVMPLEHRLASKTSLTLEDLNFYTICFPSEDMGKCSLELREHIQNNYPHIHIDKETYADIHFPLVQFDSKLFLTIYSSKDYFHNLCCLPLDCDFHTPMGFLYAENCAKAVKDFVQIVKETS